MKKLVLTIAIVLGLSCISFGQKAYEQKGGLFKRGDLPKSESYFYRGEDGEPLHFPQGLGATGNVNAYDDDLPLGSGIALLLGLGGAYFVAKRRKEEK